jgi:arylsulfatase A-like enzyme
MRQGAIETRLANNVDIASTIGQLAGIVLPAPQDGRSLVPLLTGAPTAWRDAIHLEWFGDRTNTAIPPRYLGIRDGRYKLIHYAGGPKELYDLKVDPHELVNLAGNPAYAQIEQRLRDRIGRVDG